jgi:hypothetical protein
MNPIVCDKSKLMFVARAGSGGSNRDRRDDISGSDFASLIYECYFLLRISIDSAALLFCLSDVLSDIQFQTC